VLVEGESVAIEPVAGTEQFFQVVKRTFHDGFLSEVDMTPTGFEQCSAVIDASPVRYLRRPKRYEVVPSLVEHVERDLTAEEPNAE
jgi:predicted xylose isomerase-like sugar epimerase